MTTTHRGLLRAFVRHLERQAWLAEVVRTRLRGDLGAIGTLGGFGHPQRSDDTRVPGLPEWSFFFHGMGCCLTHDDGTTLDVDFVDGTAEWIDPYFFNAYLASLPAPEPVEAALIQPDPLDVHWMADLPALRDAGFLEWKYQFRLTDAGRAEAARTDDDPEPNPAARAAHLIEGLASQETAKACLAALAVLGRVWAEPHVLARLSQSTVDGTVSTALQIVEHWADPGHAAAVLGLIARLSGDEVPRPYLREAGAAYVMRCLGPRGLTALQRGVLVSALTPSIQAGAHFLTALLDPDAGLAMLALDLRSKFSGIRSDAACALAVLGTEEAVGLLRATETHEAQTVRAFLRGEPPQPGVAPPEEHIACQGRRIRVYRFDDTEGNEDQLAAALKQFEKKRGALRTLWLSN